MAITPELGLTIASPEESKKAFLEFRTEVYDSMMVLDQVVSEIKEVQKESYAMSDADKVIQADFLQNDSTQADYIKNRPCYESVQEFTWNGDITSAPVLGIAGMCSYGQLLLSELTDVPDEFAYTVMLQTNDPYQSTASNPYVLAWCSTSPFLYGDCVDSDGETTITTIYSLDCDVRVYAYVRPGEDAWDLLNIYHYTGTSAEDIDIFRMYETSVDWSNSEIINENTDEAHTTKMTTSKFMGGSADFYRISSTPIQTENLSAINYNFVATEDGVSDSWFVSVEEVIRSQDAEDTFLADYHILNVSRIGVHGFDFGPGIMYLHFNNVGVYVVGDFVADGPMAYVDKLIVTHTKKLAHQYLPFHYIIPHPEAVDVSALDFSKYDEGDIVFVVQGA